MQRASVDAELWRLFWKRGRGTVSMPRTHIGGSLEALGRIRASVVRQDDLLRSIFNEGFRSTRPQEPFRGVRYRC